MDTLELPKKIIINVPKPPITSLVFEGGGVKGIAYAGAYRALKEKAGLLDYVQWVAGSSAGAMTALLVSLGFTVKEIEEELAAIDFSKLVDPLPDGKLATISYLMKNAHKISETLHHGVNDGVELYHWVQRIVEKKLGNKNASFLDLRRLSQSIDSEQDKPSLYKNLLIVVTNAHHRKAEVFSWETTPSLQIADAVLTSLSIPGFFYVRYIDKSMQKIDWAPTYKKINNHDIIPYVGGVLNSYFINLFHRSRYWLSPYYLLAESHAVNPCSLVLRVDTEEEVDQLIKMRKQKTMDSSGIQARSRAISHYTLQAIKTVKEPQRTSSLPNFWVSPSPAFSMVNKFLSLLTSDSNEVEPYSPATIEIKDCPITTTPLDLNQEDKDKLIKSGYDAVNNFFERDYKVDMPFKTLSFNTLKELKKEVNITEKLMELYRSLQSETNSPVAQYLNFKLNLLKQKIEIERPQENRTLDSVSSADSLSLTYSHSEAPPGFWETEEPEETQNSSCRRWFCCSSL